MNILGLMSGTSLDGIDVALADIRPRGAAYAVECKNFMTVPFERGTRDRLLAALPPNEPSVAVAAELDRAFGSELARAAASALSEFGVASVDAIASHGLTLYHRGEAGITWQIGSPYALRDELRSTVVYDFRRGDCALGGHGAPLVPHFDALAFGDDDRDVVALNLGGIANVSVVPAGSVAATLAWDTGPSNLLIDGFVALRTDGRETFDDGGAYAIAGRSDPDALAALKHDAREFLESEPPKSSGRERFGPQFLARHAVSLDGLSLSDGCATLAAFTVDCIATSVERFAPPASRMIISGGGARNAALVRGLKTRLGGQGWQILSSLSFGVDPDAKEAVAFALLAYESLRGRPANVPAATGALQAAVLGSIVPHELDALLAKIRLEVAANATA